MSNDLEEKKEEKVVDLLNTPGSLTSVEAQIVEVITEGKKIKKDIENDNIHPIGLFDDLSPDDFAFAISEARKNLEERDDFNEIKNLEKDILTVPDQNFCVVSWVGPTFKAKTDITGFRIMGAFKTLEKAQKYAQRVHREESTYDIGIMEMNLWCLGYPDESDYIFNSDGELDSDAMEKQRDKILNDFVIKHKTKLEESKQLFEIRKRAIRKSKITKEGNEEDAPLEKIPEGVPTEEMKTIHDKEVKKWIKDEEKEIKETEDDDYELNSKLLDFNCAFKIPNQEYAVISFIGYSGTNKRIPICIKGIYSTEIEAQERIKKLMHIDDTYDLVPVSLYKWVPCDPDLTLIRNEFKNSNLNNLIEASEKQKEETLSFHQVRKKYVKREEKEESRKNGENEEIEDKTDYTKEYEYKIDKPITSVFEDGRELSAVDALVEVQKFDSEDIRMRGKKYFDNDEVEISEEEFVKTFLFNSELSSKDIKDPMFNKVDNQLKELEEKIQILMVTEGISENEARNRFRLKFDKKEEKIYEDEIKPISKPKIKSINFESMEEKIDYLKKKGHTASEIRKIMSESN